MASSPPARPRWPERTRGAQSPDQLTRFALPLNGMRFSVHTTGTLPHGLWPSGDGSRICVGLENADEVAVIDTGSNKVITNVPIGQGPQGVAYVPNAVRDGRESSNLEPLLDGVYRSIVQEIP